MRKRKAVKPAVPVEVTPEERYHLINDVAYFRAIERARRSGKSEDPAESWCEAEAAIDAVIKRAPDR